MNTKNEGESDHATDEDFRRTENMGKPNVFDGPASDTNESAV